MKTAPYKILQYADLFRSKHAQCHNCIIIYLHTCKNKWNVTEMKLKWHWNENENENRN
jgi:hypothetical protein